MSKFRKLVVRKPFHESIVDTMEGLAFTKKQKAGDYRHALAVARILAITRIPSEHLAPVELAFNAMIKRMGGVRNNGHFTTAGRSDFYRAIDGFKNASRFRIRETNEPTGTEPSDAEIVNESVRPHYTGDPASAPV